MTIPFLNLFKRKAKEQETAPSQSVIAPVQKPSSERLSKTVTPNATRTAPPEDPFHTAANLNGTPANGSAYGNAPRSVSFGGMAPHASDLPPAVAFAIAPNVERVISLELRDIVQQLPAGVVKQLDNEDASRRLLLKAAEIEKGMSSGKPTVSLGSVFQQMPEIFIKPIAAGDTTPVSLPFAKVLEQFSSLQMRSDQYREQDVPQVETPFLQVTMEDNTRFGTKTGPVQSGPLPPVRLEPATAETLAAAEPEPVIPAKNASPIVSFKPAAPQPASANGNGVTPNELSVGPAASTGAATPPTRVRFKITPNGTDVPASERVPASNGPSVPTSVPSPAAPTRIAFKMSPMAAEEAVPKTEPWLTKESFASDAPPPLAAPPPKAAESESGATILLPLKPILQMLPPFQLTGDVNAVPAELRIELPFALVESQLAGGRVSLSAEDFAAHLPAEYRGLFSSKEISAPVLLPLQEVLKNLPSASLRMRDDQVEQEKGASFATPFSARAEEDAKRFNVTGGPVPKPTVIEIPATPFPLKPEAKTILAATPTPKPVVAMSTFAPPSHESSALKVAAVEMPRAKTVGRDALQTIFNTDEELDPKGIVAQINLMPGVEACAIMFGDGLSLAGELPAKFEADGLCAMAPSLLQRIENHMVETKLGQLSAMTLSCTEGAITFFLHDNLCLAAIHAKRGLAGDIHERLTSFMHELSRTYSHPV